MNKHTIGKRVLSAANRLLNRTGYQIRRTDNIEKNDDAFGRQYQHLLNEYQINLLFDVGAHIGDYAQQMRALGFKGRIVSFEPLTSAYSTLVERAKTDPAWVAVNIALGATDGETAIHISGHAMSSSIAEMLNSHLQAMPSARYIDTEPITVRALDSIFDTYYQSGDRVFMKLDTQGYERLVLEGATRALPNILGILLELSLIPLYKDEFTIAPMITLMAENGFNLVALAPGFAAPNGNLLQVYGLFFREHDALKQNLATNAA